MAGALAAGEDAARDHHIAIAKLKLKLADDMLKYAEEQAADQQRAFQAVLVPKEQLQAVLLELEQAKAGRARGAVDLEEVMASGKEPRHEIAAPLVSEKDYVTTRLEIEFRLASKRREMAERRATELKRLLAAGTGRKSGVLAAVVEVEVAAAETTAITELMRIRKSFVAGEIEQEKAERLGAKAEATARLRQAAVREGLEADRLNTIHELFAVGGATRAGVRIAEVEFARAGIEHEIAQLELAWVEQQLAAK